MATPTSASDDNYCNVFRCWIPSSGPNGGFSRNNMKMNVNAPKCQGRKDGFYVARSNGAATSNYGSGKGYSD